MVLPSDITGARREIVKYVENAGHRDGGVCGRDGRLWGGRDGSLGRQVRPRPGRCVAGKTRRVDAPAAEIGGSYRHLVRPGTVQGNTARGRGRKTAIAGEGLSRPAAGAIRCRARHGHPAQPDRLNHLGALFHGAPWPDVPGIAASEVQDLGPQGYVVHIDSAGIAAAATGAEGLFYALQTIAQIARDRTILPGVHLRDWPSLMWRGVQYDVSRGQVPKEAALERLADAIAEAKGNMLELYIEDVFKWKSHPDLSPPEAITAEEARELFRHAANRRLEVHPAFQGFGHWDKILAKPAYRPLGVSGSTIDIRKPQTIALVHDMVEELCNVFPGKFFNVDITENDAAAYSSSGTRPADFNELVFQYVLKLRDMVGAHRMRLIVMQGPLGDTGYLAGLGPVLDKLPKDLVIGSYYTAMGIYSGWEKDFPLLRKTGIDFFRSPGSGRTAG